MRTITYKIAGVFFGVYCLFTFLAGCIEIVNHLSFEHLQRAHPDAVNKAGECERMATTTTALEVCEKEFITSL